MCLFFSSFLGGIQRLEALEGVERERQRLGDLVESEGAVQTNLRGDVAAAREVMRRESDLGAREVFGRPVRGVFWHTHARTHANTLYHAETTRRILAGSMPPR